MTAIAAGPGTAASAAVAGRQIRLGWTWPERLVAAAAVVGTLMSTSHLYAFAVASGVYSPVEAVGLPLLVEVLMLALSRIALARADRGERGGLAAFGFFALVAVAVAVNYARGNPDIVITDLGEAAEAVPAVLPPLSATLAYKVLQGERRARARQLLTDSPVAEQQPPPWTAAASGDVEDDQARSHQREAGAAAAADGEVENAPPAPAGNPAQRTRDVDRRPGRPAVATGTEAADGRRDGHDGRLVVAVPRHDDGHPDIAAGRLHLAGRDRDPAAAGGRSGGRDVSAAGHRSGHSDRIDAWSARDGGQHRGQDGGGGPDRPGLAAAHVDVALAPVESVPQAGQDPWDRVSAAVAANPGVTLTKSWVAETTGIPRTTVRRLVAEHEQEWHRWVAARSGSANGEHNPMAAGGRSRSL